MNLWLAVIGDTHFDESVEGSLADADAITVLSPFVFPAESQAQARLVAARISQILEIAIYLEPQIILRPEEGRELVEGETLLSCAKCGTHIYCRPDLVDPLCEGCCRDSVTEGGADPP